MRDPTLLSNSATRSGLPETADFIGKAVIGGQPYKVHAYWNTSRDGVLGVGLNG